MASIKRLLNKEGYLTLQGRKDNLFISGGENICPEEIEMCIGKILGIVNVMVVPIENEEFGKRPVCFLDLENFNEPEIRRELEKHLPRFKVPDHFLPWPSLNSEEQMKLSRRHFIKLAEEELLKPKNH